MRLATTAKRPTVEDLTTLPTCASVPVELPSVTWPDGSAVVVEVRALTFRERSEAIRAAQVKRDDHYVIDEEKWALEVVRRGLLVPTITPQQLAVLESLNANVIDAICDAIITLGSVNPRAISAELERLAGMATPPKATARRAKRGE